MLEAIVIDVERAGDHAKLRLIGELNGHNKDLVTDVVRGLIDRKVRSVEFDLTEVSPLVGHGAECIIRAYGWTRGQAWVVGASEQAREKLGHLHLKNLVRAKSEPTVVTVYAVNSPRTAFVLASV